MGRTMFPDPKLKQHYVTIDNYLYTGVPGDRQWVWSNRESHMDLDVIADVEVFLEPDRLVWLDMIERASDFSYDVDEYGEVKEHFDTSAWTFNGLMINYLWVINCTKWKMGSGLFHAALISVMYDHLRVCPDGIQETVLDLLSDDSFGNINFVDMRNYITRFKRHLGI